MPTKLGEALARRSELQARLVEVRDRLRVSALVQEGGRPAEEPDPLLAELGEIADELERLITSINHTNATSQLGSGIDLTSALARRDVLGLLHGALKAVVDSTAQQQARYSRSEIPLVRTFDVAAVRARMDELARERQGGNCPRSCTAGSPALGGVRATPSGSTPESHSDAPHRDPGIAHSHRASPRRWISTAARVGEGTFRVAPGQGGAFGKVVRGPATPAVPPRSHQHAGRQRGRC